MTTAAIVAPLSQPAERKTHSHEGLLWCALIFVSLACIALHLGAILTYLFPLMIFSMAIVFQRTSPKAYVRLLIIALMYTPLVRRLSDWTSEYTEPSPMLIAPLIAPFASLLSLRYRELLRPRELPFVLAGIGILYGLAVGLVSNHLSVSMLVSFLRWSNPLVWGLYVVQRQKDREDLAATLVNTLRWTTLACAIYGLIQVSSPLPWDVIWLKAQLANGSLASFGANTSAFGFRLFSTLNSCGVAAPILGIGTIAWLASTSKIRFVALPFLVASVLLTMVRTEWLCVPASIVVMIILAGKYRAPVVSACVSAGCVVLLAASTIGTAEPDMMGKLADRITGMGQGSRDESYSARTMAMVQGISMLLHMPFGAGLGFLDSAAYDSTPMSFSSGAAGGDLAFVGMLFDLGYVGAIAYSVGVVIVLFSMFRHKARDKLTAAMLISVAVSTVMHFWSNIPFVAPEAFFFWAAAAVVDGV